MFLRSEAEGIPAAYHEIHLPARHARYASCGSIAAAESGIRSSGRLLACPRPEDYGGRFAFARTSFANAACSSLKRFSVLCMNTALGARTGRCNCGSSSRWNCGCKHLSMGLRHKFELETLPQQVAQRMRQVLQDARSGAISVEEVPAPQLLPGCVLVRIAASVVSAGTERASARICAEEPARKGQISSGPGARGDQQSAAGRDFVRSAGGPQPSGSAAESRLQQRWHSACDWRRRYRYPAWRSRGLRRCWFCRACGDRLHSAFVAGANSRAKSRSQALAKCLSTRLHSQLWARSRCTAYAQRKRSWATWWL